MLFVKIKTYIYCIYILYIHTIYIYIYTYLFTSGFLGDARSKHMNEYAAPLMLMWFQHATKPLTGLGPYWSATLLGESCNVSDGCIRLCILTMWGGDRSFCGCSCMAPERWRHSNHATNNLPYPTRTANCKRKWWKQLCLAYLHEKSEVLRELQKPISVRPQVQKT